MCVGRSHLESHSELQEKKTNVILIYKIKHTFFGKITGERGGGGMVSQGMVLLVVYIVLLRQEA